MSLHHHTRRWAHLQLQIWKTGRRMMLEIRKYLHYASTPSGAPLPQPNAPKDTFYPRFCGNDFLCG